MPSVMDYSERGLVNSLFESILQAHDPCSLLTELLETATMVESGGGCHKYQSYSKLQDFTVFIEPSLSQFGNPDVVLLLDYEKNSAQEQDRRIPLSSVVVFIEAKIESFMQSLRKKPLDRNSSSILHELFLKARLHRYLTEDISGKSPFTGVPVYSADLVYKNGAYNRKVGADPQVLDLVEKIKGRKAYYFGLTTDRGHQAAQWPEQYDTGNEIAKQIERICQANIATDPDDLQGLSFTMKESMFVWSWHDLYDYAKTSPQMERFIKAVEWNLRKFSFKHLQDPSLNFLLKEWSNRLGLIESKRDESGERQTFNKDKKAVFTCRIADSFEGQALEVMLRKPDGSRPNMLIPFEHISEFLLEDRLSDRLRTVHEFCK